MAGDNEQPVAASSSSYIKPPNPLQINGNNLSTSWKNWIQQYNWFSTAVQMDKKSAEIQVATFMSSIGADAINIFNSFSLSSDEKKNVKTIQKKFEEYFAPKISVTFERYKFNTLCQNEGETFEEFYIKIKNQAKKCDFGSIEDSLLKDKIVVGIGSDTVREKLLSQDDIDLEKAIKICKASEMATQQLKELHKTEEFKIEAIRKYAKPQTFKKYEKNVPSYDCKRCGNNHESRNCPAYNNKCRNCLQRGHFAKFCFKNKKHNLRHVNTLQQREDVDSDVDSDLFVLMVKTSETTKDDNKNWYEEIIIDDKKVTFKLDSAADGNIIPLSFVNKKHLQTMKKSKNKLIAFGGGKIDICGEITLTCIVRDKPYETKFLVVEDFQNLQPLLGKEDCERFKLIVRVNEVKFDSNIFEGLGKVKNFVYNIDLIENPTFEHYAPRRIPHALKATVKKEIDAMVKLGVLKRTNEITPAVSPMVVVKQKGKIRVCIDPTDINKNIQRRYHPLKTLDEITANIQNSKWFTLLDCKKGFWQIELTKRTQKYLTMATPWGRYSYLRLPFGLASAPEVYQQLMSQLLEDIDNTEVSMDDILIHAETREKLKNQTEKVIKKLSNSGHILTSEGIAADPEKIAAINQLKKPENRTQLQRVLGMATYLCKFIRSKSREFALDAINRQRAEFRSWGVLADWVNSKRLYFTFDPDFICNQLQLFLKFYEKGLVYRDLKPVYWSPSSRTALAEAELEYDSNFESPSVYVRFPLKSTPPSVKLAEHFTLFALIWTTTPWSLPSNQAICFNSNLDYSVIEMKSNFENRPPGELYLLASNLIEAFVKNTKIDCIVKQIIAGTELINCTYQHPMYAKDLLLPFFDGSHVKDNKGTGLVHTAPAHGADDFLICMDKKIPLKSIVNSEGVYNCYAPSFLKGKNVLKEGNELVLNSLKENVLYSDTITHSYPLDWRTKEPVIIRASEQWFVNTSKLKKRAVEEIDKIQIYPRVNAEASKNALRNQIMARPYWCISRQRSWGVPIPVLYHKTSKRIICNGEIMKHICNLVTQEGNIDFWWSTSLDAILPPTLLTNLNIDVKEVEKGMDIFDIWFDSGSSWSHVSKGQQVADLYLEGYDQCTGWFQSSLLTSIGARNCAPYKALFVHGFTVDEKGYKMSKSVGNVISPRDVRETYGIDALRWWVASHGTQNMAITVSDKLLQQSADSLSKIRTTLRYLNGVIGERTNEAKCIAFDKQIYLNRYLLSKLCAFENQTSNLYNYYEYNRVVAYIQNFVANEISAVYVNLIKDRLYCGTTAEIAAISASFEKCYTVLCKALWPIVPFVVEESWSYYDKSSSFHQQQIVSCDSLKNSAVEKVVETALNVKRLINQRSRENNCWLLSVKINCNENTIDLLQHLHPILEKPIIDSELCEILQVGSVTLQKCSDVCADYDVKINKIESYLCPRCRRHAVVHEMDICHRCNKVLELQNRTVAYL